MVENGIYQPLDRNFTASCRHSLGSVLHLLACAFCVLSRTTRNSAAQSKYYCYGTIPISALPNRRSFIIVPKADFHFEEIEANNAVW